jgi:hypothetical protein
LITGVHSADASLAGTVERIVARKPIPA